MTKFDWNAIKTEYVTQGASIRGLASKYGPAKNAIQKRCDKEGWTAEREKYLGITTTHRTKVLAATATRRTKALTNEVVKKLAECKGETEAKGFEQIADTMVKEVGRVSDMLAEEGLSSTNRYNLMRCLEIANKLYKDAMGIMSRAEVERLEMARAELKIKQEEHAKFMSESNQGTEPIQVEFKDDIKEYSE